MAQQWVACPLLTLLRPASGTNHADRSVLSRQPATALRSRTIPAAPHRCSGRPTLCFTHLESQHRQLLTRHLPWPSNYIRFSWRKCLLCTMDSSLLMPTLAEMHPPGDARSYHPLQLFRDFLLTSSLYDEIRSCWLRILSNHAIWTRCLHNGC